MIRTKKAVRILMLSIGTAIALPVVMTMTAGDASATGYALMWDGFGAGTCQPQEDGVCP